MSKSNVSVNFFEYTDGTLTCNLSKAVLDNDVHGLLKLLKRRKKGRTSRSPLSADNRKWTAVHIAASQSRSEHCLEALLKFRSTLLIDVNDKTFEGKTALFIACEKNCLENVKLLLQAGSDPNIKKLDGSSPLLVAAEKGYHEIVQILLEYNASINDQDWEGFTPLHLAAMNGHLNICQLLVEKEANSFAIDSYGNLPLHSACRNEYPEIVYLLVQKDASSINFKNDRGFTPLMLSLQDCNSLECINYLLNHGAKTEICNFEKMTSLQFAILSGKVDVVKSILLKTNLEFIEMYCLREFLNVLRNEGTFHSLVCCAISSGSVDCLLFLLKYKFPKHILEAPSAVTGNILKSVFTPLSHLVNVFSESDDFEIFIKFFKILVENDIIYINEFSRVLKLKLKLPKACIEFVDPFTKISEFELHNAKRYFHLLTSNNVTPDYCLRCYNDNSIYFEYFNQNFTYYFPLYYKQLFLAISECNITIVSMFISCSSLIEPDLLLNHFVTIKCKLSFEDFHKNYEEIKLMAKFLIKLKPSYYKYNRFIDTVDNWFSTLLPKYEEFSELKLKQLCRTIIRRELREKTIEENLLHYHCKISQLPLPSTLIDYLLFKD